MVKDAKILRVHLAGKGNELKFPSDILVDQIRAIDIKKQSDGRIKKWSYIKEAGKYLRVILLNDGETVHNAFFDRGFKEE